MRTSIMSLLLEPLSARPIEPYWFQPTTDEAPFSAVPEGDLGDAAHVLQHLQDLAGQLVDLEEGEKKEQ